MARNLFSVPIFFIVFRETLEAAIIIASLLGLVEQIVYSNFHQLEGQTPPPEEDDKKEAGDISLREVPDVEDGPRKRRLLRKMRFQIFLGSALGFLIAVTIGTIFIVIWFTKASDLYKKSEELWEGIFELIATILIFVMGITMLKLDHAKTKWRVKLQDAFEGQHVTGRVRTGKWALFTLPFIVVLREGLEAVVFVGGVSLGQSARAIPIAAITGIVCGLICGFVIYTFASRATLSVFLVVITNFILLIGAGLFSKSVGAFQENAFNHLIGGDSDSGDGPGSFDVRGNVWHLDCCNAANEQDGNGWLLFGAITGWTNNATLGTVLSYVFYWLAAIVTLVALKWREGRLRVFGLESAAGKARRLRQTADTSAIHEDVPPLVNPTGQISELPK
ncbi:iron permease FTR1 [Russula ochroleuca]|jgi:high-affinity iron transporter|uniref:Iron permease FTR1 n=1 Tax=Russula ochroleuca TaxID=152965 RepID=A0A9P5T9P2_9AGAM|nr:iron permease FTR1 [Russula ochroleuca]